jgi:hypothetical protein
LFGRKIAAAAHGESIGAAQSEKDGGGSEQDRVAHNNLQFIRDIRNSHSAWRSFSSGSLFTDRQMVPPARLFNCCSAHKTVSLRERP